MAVPISVVVLVIMAVLAWYLFVYDAPSPPLLDNMQCTLVDGYHCQQEQRP